MVPGRDGTQAALLFARTSLYDYMQIFSLDVLGVEDRPEGDQLSIYQEFKELLVQRKDGKYETSLSWKVGHPKLPTNQNTAKNRFNSLIRRFDKQSELFRDYHSSIQDQLRKEM